MRRQGRGMIGKVGKMAALAGGVLAAAAGWAGAQPINVNLVQPAIDRWVYPFNQASPLGSELVGQAFSSLGSQYEAQFDNRDGQFLLGFDTSGLVTPGRGERGYRILEGAVTAWVGRDVAFRYDPTVDPVGSYFPVSDPQYVADTDPGARPVEVFGVGYRDGFTALTFQEDTPHSAFGPFPDKRHRRAFAAQFDLAGNAADVSNNVDERFTARPMAVGTASGLAAGDLVPINTMYTFALNVSDPTVREYVARSLNQGRLNLMITSLTMTSQQGSDAAVFYSKEYPQSIGGVPARIELIVCTRPRADFDCNGQVEPQDIALFVNAWLTDLAMGPAGGMYGDFDLNGVTEPSDIALFINAWLGALGG